MQNDIPGDKIGSDDDEDDWHEEVVESRYIVLQIGDLEEKYHYFTPNLSEKLNSFVYCKNML